MPCRAVPCHAVGGYQARAGIGMGIGMWKGNIYVCEGEKRREEGKGEGKGDEKKKIIFQLKLNIIIHQPLGFSGASERVGSDGEGFTSGFTFFSFTSSSLLAFFGVLLSATATLGSATSFFFSPCFGLG